MKLNKKGEWGIIGGIIVILFILVALGYDFIYSITYSDTTIKVKDKWVDVQNKEGKYLIGTESGEVFIIQDTLINMRYDSSTLYNKISVGQTCKIHTNGWRLPILSDYRNILTAECS